VEVRQVAQLKVYGAPWCPDCRRAKRFLSEHRVGYEWIDVDRDPDGLAYVQQVQNGGRTIPTILFEDGSVLIEPSNNELAARLGMTLRADRDGYDLAIVGGGPAGLAAAIYAAREGIDAIVIDKSALGGQAGVTERVDNYPGFPDGIGGAELADRFTAQARRYGVELLSAVDVRQLSTDCGGVQVSLGTGQQLCASAAIVATGSSYRRLGVPGENELIGAGVHYCATCDGPFYKGAEELLVIGGGNSGLEEGMFLAQFAERIRVVEFGPTLTASPLLRDNVANDRRFTVHTNTEITQLRGEGGKLREVVGRDRDTGEELHWHPAGAFVFIGLDPNTGFLRETLELDKWGFIVTDDTFATSMPGVYAAGDARAGSTKQLGAAVGDGIAALLHARQHLQRAGATRSVQVNA
jgi:thioredoxin reductase (NADPH)